MKKHGNFKDSAFNNGIGNVQFFRNYKSNRFKLRVIDLCEMKKALNLIITKMRYTYEPLPELFKEVSKAVKSCLENHR